MDRFLTLAIGPAVFHFSRNIYRVAGATIVPEATDESGHRCGRFNRCRQSNTLEFTAETNQSIHCRNKQGSPLAAGHRMNFIQNDRTYAPQNGSPATP